MSPDTLPSDPKLLMRSIIQRIATGPDLSKDISRAEAHLGTKAIIDNVIDPVQVGIYFIALRMKRETDEENLGLILRNFLTGRGYGVDCVTDGRAALQALRAEAYDVALVDAPAAATAGGTAP